MSQPTGRELPVKSAYPRIEEHFPGEARPIARAMAHLLDLPALRTMRMLPPKDSAIYVSAAGSRAHAWRHLKAALLQASQPLSKRPCERCHQGKGFWPDCVGATDDQCCANCIKAGVRKSDCRPYSGDSVSPPPGSSATPAIMGQPTQYANEGVSPPSLLGPAPGLHDPIGPASGLRGLPNSLPSLRPLPNPLPALRLDEPQQQPVLSLATRFSEQGYARDPAHRTESSFPTQFSQTNAPSLELAHPYRSAAPLHRDLSQLRRGYEQLSSTQRGVMSRDYETRLRVLKSIDDGDDRDGRMWEDVYSDYE
ncbi:hypothetical protein F5Y16DRAFT_399852 [Xylariaceae sp. FL0255]|nr:hypothetical protein F5Y16DRAFT_399852 [Xylariaceae sp. FL0255]